MSEFTGNIDLSAIDSKLDAILAELKRIGSVPGGENPPSPETPLPTGRKWAIRDAEFYLNGQHQFFVTGGNLREGAFPAFPHLDNTKWAHNDDVQKTLDSIARDLKGKVVRVWAANSRLPTGTMGTDAAFCIKQLKQFLAWAAQRNLDVIVCLTDMVGAQGLHCYDPRPEMRNQWGYSEAWYAGGFQQTFLPFVRAVVGELANHPAIFSWQIGNEIQAPRDPSDPAGNVRQSLQDAQAMYNFFETMVNEIKSFYPNNKPRPFIMSGIIDTWHVYTDYQVQFESKHHDLFDIVSFHSYMNIKPDEPELGEGHNWLIAHEIPMARNKKKPIVWDEAGVNRRELEGGAEIRLLKGLRYLFNRGGDAALQWGMMTPVGNNDLNWGAPGGMHTVTNGAGDLPSQDYDELAQAWTEAALWIA